MNTITGLALIAAGVYFLCMAIGGAMGSVTDETRDGIIFGAAFATIIVVTMGLIGAGAWVLTA